eukprot:COSAG05_NODE_1834_length_3997_cov_127.609131_5_plen_121_part_00
MTEDAWRAPLIATVVLAVVCVLLWHTHVRTHRVWLDGVVMAAVQHRMAELKSTRAQQVQTFFRARQGQPAVAAELQRQRERGLAVLQAVLLKALARAQTAERRAIRQRAVQVLLLLLPCP